MANKNLVKIADRLGSIKQPSNKKPNGKVDLEKYIKLPNANQKDLLSGIPNQDFGVERAAYKTLSKLVRKIYPVMDLSFLKMSNDDRLLAISYDEKDIYLTLPRFSVYSIENPRYFIEIEEKDYKHIDPLSIYHIPSMGSGWIMKESMMEIEDMDIEDEMLIICQEGEIPYSEYKKLEHGKGSFDVSDEKLTIETTFNGIIPIETRDKINDALKVFDTKSIFIISEENNWRIPYSSLSYKPALTGSSLVIAKYPHSTDPNESGMGYLIDRFYATHYRDYIFEEDGK